MSVYNFLLKKKTFNIHFALQQTPSLPNSQGDTHRVNEFYFSSKSLPNFCFTGLHRQDLNNLKIWDESRSNRKTEQMLIKSHKNPLITPALEKAC